MPVRRKKSHPEPEPAQILTAIHIGASSVSAIVCERSGQAILPVDFLEQPVPVARDIFGNIP